MPNSILDLGRKAATKAAHRRPGHSRTGSARQEVLHWSGAGPVLGWGEQGVTAPEPAGSKLEFFFRGVRQQLLNSVGPPAVQRPSSPSRRASLGRATRLRMGGTFSLSFLRSSVSRSASSLSLLVAERSIFISSSGFDRPHAAGGRGRAGLRLSLVLLYMFLLRHPRASPSGFSRRHPLELALQRRSLPVRRICAFAGVARLGAPAAYPEKPADRHLFPDARRSLGAHGVQHHTGAAAGRTLSADFSILCWNAAWA